MKTKDIVNISLFTTLLAVCAWICIPMAVPFTMQTFAVFLAMLVLGGKRGTMVIFIYLLLGLIGVPVFSGGTAGIGSLLGPTGGYMIGWVFLGLFVFLGDKIVGKGMKKRMQFTILFIGLVICYFFGTLWFVKIYANNGEFIGFASALSICVFPYVIPDIMKMFLAFLVSKRMKNII